MTVHCNVAAGNPVTSNGLLRDRNQKVSINLAPADADNGAWEFSAPLANGTTRLIVSVIGEPDLELAFSIAQDAVCPGVANANALPTGA